MQQRSKWEISVPLPGQVVPVPQKVVLWSSGKYCRFEIDIEAQRDVDFVE